MSIENTEKHLLQKNNTHIATRRKVSYA